MKLTKRKQSQENTLKMLGEETNRYLEMLLFPILQVHYVFISFTSSPQRFSQSISFLIYKKGINLFDIMF